MFNTAAAQQSQTLGYVSMLGFFFVPLTFVAVCRPPSL
jgi:Mg2+ and Co2+ transporter CorA